MRLGVGAGGRTGLEALRRALQESPHLIAWTALTAADVVTQCRSQAPDVLVLELDFPDGDGVEVVKTVMRDSPCAILLVAPAGQVGRVYEAMGHGALDVVVPPELDLEGRLTRETPLLSRLHNLAKLVQSETEAEVAVSDEARPASPIDSGALVAIGASTGGPQVLGGLLGRLPQDLGASVVVVQHIDAAFASGLASWLTERTNFPVVLARPGEFPRTGRAYLASTEDHLVLDERGAFAHVVEPARAIHRPSIDVFFRSLVSRGSLGLAVLLTGMGRDGAEGLLALRRAGWSTVCQDRESAVVPAMPLAAIELQAAEQVLSPSAIAATIIAFAGRAARR